MQYPRVLVISYHFLLGGDANLPVYPASGIGKIQSLEIVGADPQHWSSVLHPRSFSNFMISQFSIVKDGRNVSLRKSHSPWGH